MKATLEFNLPEEQQEHADAIQGREWRAACQDTRMQIRNWLKYGHSFKTADEALEEVRKGIADATEGLLTYE